MKLEIYDIELSEKKIENLIRAFSGFNLMEDLFEYLKKVGWKMNVKCGQPFPILDSYYIHFKPTYYEANRTICKW